MGMEAPHGARGGRADFPMYMKLIHWEWLNRTGEDSVKTSITNTLNQAFLKTQFDVSGSLVDAQDSYGIPNFRVFELLNLKMFADVSQEYLDCLSVENYQVYLDQIKSELEVNRSFDPEKLFKSSCRDLGIIDSSNYVIGLANFMKGYINIGGTFVSGHLGIYLTNVKNILMQRIIFDKFIIQDGCELARQFLAYSFQTDQMKLEWSAKDRLEHVRMWEYGSHVLAGITGRTVEVEPATSVQDRALYNAQIAFSIGALYFVVGGIFTAAAAYVDTYVRDWLGIAEETDPWDWG